MTNMPFPSREVSDFDELLLLDGLLGRVWRPWIVKALTILLAAVFIVNVSPYWIPQRDSALYMTLARSLARGEGFQEGPGVPHTLVYPGFPLILAGVMKLFGERMFFMNLCVTLMGMGCIALTYLVMKPWLEKRVAMLVAFLTGSTHTLLNYSGVLITDVPHLFFTLLSLWLIQLTWFAGSARRRLLAGLCAGVSVMAAAMIRPNGLFILVPLALAMVIFPRRVALKTWEKLVVLGVWLAAVGIPLLCWVLFIGNVDAEIRKTYLQASILSSGFAPFVGNMLRQLADFPEELAKTLGRNTALPPGNLLILAFFLVGLVRMIRFGAWHVSAYAVVGTAFATIDIQRRYLLAILPLTVACSLIGAAWMALALFRASFVPRKRRKLIPWALLGLIIFMPLANVLPVAKLTWEKHRRPFYQKHGEGNWSDHMVLAEWMRESTPEHSVFWARDSYVLAYFSDRTVRGPATPWEGESEHYWRRDVGLQNHLAHWKPDYIVVDTDRRVREIIENRLIARRRLKAQPVEIEGVYQLRVYKVLEPPVARK